MNKTFFSAFLLSISSFLTAEFIPGKEALRTMGRLAIDKNNYARLDLSVKNDHEFSANLILPDGTELYLLRHINQASLKTTVLRSQTFYIVLSGEAKGIYTQVDHCPELVQRNLNISTNLACLMNDFLKNFFVLGEINEILENKKKSLNNLGSFDNLHEQCALLFEKIRPQHKKQIGLFDSETLKLALEILQTAPDSPDL